jgi:hypothetical protein
LFKPACLCASRPSQCPGRALPSFFAGLGRSQRRFRHQRDKRPVDSVRYFTLPPGGSKARNEPSGRGIGSRCPLPGRSFLTSDPPGGRVKRRRHATDLIESTDRLPERPPRLPCPAVWDESIWNHLWGPVLRVLRIKGS